MDPKITGKFISELRKEKNLTQKELAEKLNVSDKAISKWECGRGYPDVESLVALSDEFSVSINEILCGERIETPVEAKEAEKDIAATYIVTNKKRRKNLIIAVILGIVLAIVTVLSALFIYLTASKMSYKFYSDIVGSSDCVIAGDYSYLTLFGEKYVPLNTGESTCDPGDKLVKEAQVEGAGFFGKLFFGETIYSIKGCENNDVVFLRSDYDDLESEFYCREDMVDHYTQMCEEVPYDQMIAELYTAEWEVFDVVIDDEIRNMIESVDLSKVKIVTCEWSRNDDDEMITVVYRQSGGLFRRDLGELIMADGEYYWIDIEKLYFEETPDHECFRGVALDDEYDTELDELFSKMFK